MNIELGPEHDKIIEELYALRDRLQMSPDERLIVEMAIQIVEYLDGYVADMSVQEYLELSSEEQKAAEDRDAAAKRSSRGSNGTSMTLSG